MGKNAKKPIVNVFVSDYILEAFCVKIIYLVLTFFLLEMTKKIPPNIFTVLG